MKSAEGTTEFICRPFGAYVCGESLARDSSPANGLSCLWHYIIVMALLGLGGTIADNHIIYYVNFALTNRQS